MEDLPEVRVGGSFKRTFSTTGGEISKNFMRVSDHDSTGHQLSVQSGTKKQWMDAISNARKAVEKSRAAEAAKKRPTSLEILRGVTAVEEDGDVTPTTPSQPTPPSPPIEFITPQPKKKVPLNAVTPMHPTSPTLLLRQDDGNVKRLVIEEDAVEAGPSGERTPAALTPILPKSSLV